MGKDQALIATNENTYDYVWVDKNDPRASQTHYLLEHERIGDPSDGGIHDNLMILGDSGDALESLTRVPELAKTYVGNIKCIYIDPPFNTGDTFTNYEDNLEHSVWLTFMRDRLRHMERLLADDGSIWVHLDDHENHRMRLLMDEVFGPGNFLAEVVWEKADSPRGDSGRFSKDHDVILAYRKSPEASMNRMPRTEEDNARFSNPDGDSRGPWFSGDRSAPGNLSGSLQHPSTFGIQHPITGEMLYPSRGRHWTFGKERLLKSLSQYAEYVEIEPNVDARIENTGLNANKVRKDVGDLILKDPARAAESTRLRQSQDDWPEFFVTDVSFGRKSYPPEYGEPPRTWWKNAEVGHNRSAKSEIKALFPNHNAFDTPKPERLIERVLAIATDPGDIVMDVFGGSGTTAAVAHKMRRRWVTVELRQDNFETFTKPRLEKVVSGNDPGGITTITERIAVDGVELPENVTPIQAQGFSTLLGRFEDGLAIEVDLNKTLASRVRKAQKDDELPLNPDETKELLRLLRKLGAQTQDLALEAVRQLKRKARTRDQKTTRWQGGGGFTVAKLSPTWVDVLEDEFTDELVPVLTDAATGDVLRRSVAAELRYEMLEGSVFAGKKGRKYLAVIEGLATEAIVDELVWQLPERGAAITLVCDTASDGVHRYLTNKAPGSTLKIMPDDLFHVSNRNKDD